MIIQQTGKQLVETICGVQFAHHQILLKFLMRCESEDLFPYCCVLVMIVLRACVNDVREMMEGARLGVISKFQGGKLQTLIQILFP